MADTFGVAPIDYRRARARAGRRPVAAGPTMIDQLKEPAS
jgi:hypothetical protein